MMKKDLYESPRIEVIKLENEGVIASSVFDIPNKPMNSVRTSGTRYSGNATLESDVEDMINDILTVGE